MGATSSALNLGLIWMQEIWLNNSNNKLLGLLLGESPQ